MIVLGHKHFETRSWKRNNLIGERIAIHAAKRPPRNLPRDLIDELATLELAPSGLPLGAVLGNAVVSGFHHTELISSQLTWREIAFGDYSVGKASGTGRNISFLRLCRKYPI